MSINHLILRNLKKNIKNYYLYVFALVFSVALYFSFVTLQYDPSMDMVKGSIKGAAAIRTASILLVAIVSIFILYANSIFIKRRGKEIGLFQLIGLTKGKIFRILSVENFILYFSSIVVGILVGFSVSKLLLMILLKITRVEEISTLHFSTEAFLQTCIVFAVIYFLIMLMNYIFIKRQSILSLFRVVSSTEDKKRRVSIFEIIIGSMGIILVILGYLLSSQLFGGRFTTMTELFLAMIMILASVIIGTYFFYKGSVRVICNMIRKKKDGYLKVTEVLSLSSIMFRMKSNALLLTIITTVSALAIGLLSLSYISYYSSENSTKFYVAADFAIYDLEHAERFTNLLERNEIQFSQRNVHVLQVHANLENVMNSDVEEMNMDPTLLQMAVVSDKDVEDIDVMKDEAVFAGTNDLLKRFISLKDSGPIELKGLNEVIPLQYISFKKEAIISWNFTNGGFPLAIVDEVIFEQLIYDVNPEIQRESSLYVGMDILDRSKLEEANAIFRELNYSHIEGSSRLDMSDNQKKNMGLIMFIVGFLGLTFLITSGCILYFKQMDEGAEEQENYTILRKLGFTQKDLLKGIQAKQVFNFGIPLLIGLLHSYFAVQSGWFFFGTELWTPMIVVMIFYTVLYSIFGILSVQYYKKVIKEAL